MNLGVINYGIRRQYLVRAVVNNIKGYTVCKRNKEVNHRATLGSILHPPHGATENESACDQANLQNRDFFFLHCAIAKMQHLKV